MPPKAKTETATIVNTAPVAIEETPFDPVPYETKDICTSITLLLCPEKEVVIRALSIISAYSDLSECNVAHIYKNGILYVLLELIKYSDITILRFALKLISLLVTTVEDAANEFLNSKYFEHVQNMNYIFINFGDQTITEFCSAILSIILRKNRVISQVLQTGIIVKVFEVLKTSEDADCQLNTLKLLSNLIVATEASDVFPFVPEVSIKILLCCLKHKISEIQTVTFDIINSMIGWKSSVMQEILKEEHIVEIMLQIIMNNDFKTFHKKAFKAICTCISCRETASYFVQSLEFVEFCEWAKSCPDRYILPTVTILETLAALPELRQVLFDFSFEDTLLSFFRVDNVHVFYKTCAAIHNMTKHKYCCNKVMTPFIIQQLLKPLSINSSETMQCHEIALQTLNSFLKRHGRTIDIIVACGGVAPITSCLIEHEKDYSEEGVLTLFNIIYIFAYSHIYRDEIMSLTVFEIMLNAFESEEKCSEMALFILTQYIDNSEYRHFFTQFNGPAKVLKKLMNTRSEVMFKSVLVYIKRLFIYKKIGMQFLMQGALKVLTGINKDIQQAIPSIREVINLMYDLYLPIKFHDVGRLETSDILPNRFYLINGLWKEDFPFLDTIEKESFCFKKNIYIVDFTADTREMSHKSMRLRDSLPTFLSRKTSSSIKVKTSLRRISLNIKSTILPMKFTGTRTATTTGEFGRAVMSCTIPPNIKYGAISEDPYLPKYAEKLCNLINEDGSRVYCLNHQVHIAATFVHALFTGSESSGNSSQNYCQYYTTYVAMLKEKLGTNVIPIGYMRCGGYCERALLFKALADKVGIPTTLVRGKEIQGGELKFWNEVPLIVEEKYKDSNDERCTHLSYAVVDLVNNIGKLYLFGTVQADDYCGVSK